MVNKVAITALALAPPATARAQAGADGVNLVRLCELAQEVTQAESGQRVLKIALQTMGDGAAGPTVLKPFGLPKFDSKLGKFAIYGFPML